MYSKTSSELTNFAPLRMFFLVLYAKLSVKVYPFIHTKPFPVSACQIAWDHDPLMPDAIAVKSSILFGLLPLRIQYSPSIGIQSIGLEFICKPLLEKCINIERMTMGNSNNLLWMLKRSYFSLNLLFFANAVSLNRVQLNPLYVAPENHLWYSVPDLKKMYLKTYESIIVS